MKNIVLIGMPGAGKSTIGVLLAKTMLMDFVDTDLIIQNKHKSALCDLIEEHGTDGFLKIENEAICACEFKNSVVATGGSAVYGEEAMAKLRENATVVYLMLSLDTLKNRLADIKTRGVAMKNGETLDELFAERAPLYEKYADIILDCEGLSPEKAIEKLIENSAQ